MYKEAEAALKGALSTENIKKASKGHYPMANPWGELVRARQRLEKMAQDASNARGKNEALLGEAIEKVAFSVKQHLLGEGGNLGEIAHAWGAVAEPKFLKEAMSQVAPYLVKQGFNMPRLKADMAQYEMTKMSSFRPVNPEHPMVQSFASWVKLAQGQMVLEHAEAETEGLLKRAHEVVGKVASWEGFQAKVKNMPQGARDAMTSRIGDAQTARRSAGRMYDSARNVTSQHTNANKVMKAVSRAPMGFGAKLKSMAGQ